MEFLYFPLFLAAVMTVVIAAMAQMLVGMIMGGNHPTDEFMPVRQLMDAIQRNCPHIVIPSFMHPHFREWRMGKSRRYATQQKNHRKQQNHFFHFWNTPY
jgi:hypothetical protein